MQVKLIEWLKKQGYPLEMKVAQEFSKGDFIVTQSNYYIDSDSEKSREIDIVSALIYTNGKRKIYIYFIIECKNNLSKPWVCLSSNKHTLSNKNLIIQRPATSNAKELLEFLSDKSTKDIKKVFCYSPSFSYNIIQSFENESDVVYSALMSVVKAIKYRIKKNESSNSDDIEIFFPMIVTGGKLFNCYSNEENQLEVTEIESTTLAWRNSLLSNVNTIIEIHTIPSLQSRLNGLKKAIDKMLMKDSISFFKKN
jgi:transposase